MSVPRAPARIFADRIRASRRLGNLLCNEGTASWDEIVSRGPLGMAMVHGMGRVSMDELEALMARHGIRWAGGDGV